MGSSSDSNANPSEQKPRWEGREEELGSLSKAVKRLITLTLLNSADPKETAQISKELNVLADRLQTYVKDGPYRPYIQSLSADKDNPPELSKLFRFDPMMGIYNPRSLPMEVEWQPPKAIGHANFGYSYMGPPECVHGGIISAYFDQIFTVANAMNATAGPTARLTVHYRNPTPLNENLRFEAFVKDVSGSRVTTVGSCWFEDTLTAEAEGLFIMLAPDKIRELGKRSGGAKGSKPSSPKQPN